MLEPLAERTVIIGNSGSGKSTLAEAIASLVHIPVIDLDLLHWEQDGYGAKRNEDVARQMALDVSNQPRWIIEGVFGWLAEIALPKARALVWLDFPWSLCRAGCRPSDVCHPPCPKLEFARHVGWAVLPETDAQGLEEPSRAVTLLVAADTAASKKGRHLWSDWLRVDASLRIMPRVWLAHRRTESRPCANSSREPVASS